VRPSILAVWALMTSSNLVDSAVILTEDYIDVYGGYADHLILKPKQLDGILQCSGRHARAMSAPAGKLSA
jgi:hypothetical protein